MLFRSGESGLPSWIPLVVIIATYVIAWLVIRAVWKRLVDSGNWSLTDALSEKAKISPQAPPVGAAPPVQGPSDPDLAVVLAGSASRLIAFIGLIIIMIMFLGMGALVMVRFFVLGCDTTGTNFDNETISLAKYLLAGTVMFAPYGANQIKAAISSFSKS